MVMTQPEGDYWVFVKFITRDDYHDLEMNSKISLKKLNTRLYTDIYEENGIKHYIYLYYFIYVFTIHVCNCYVSNKG